MLVSPLIKSLTSVSRMRKRKGNRSPWYNFNSFLFENKPELSGRLGAAGLRCFQVAASGLCGGERQCHPPSDMGLIKFICLAVRVF